MPKMKTNKAIAKRVKVTGRGKLMRHRPGTSHLKSRKSPARLRRMRSRAEVTGGFVRHVRSKLGI